MLTIKPELQSVNPLEMTVRSPLHIKNGGAVGFSGSHYYGGILQELTPEAKLKGLGEIIAELGTKIGADAALRAGGASEGLNRNDPSNFANVMLSAIDKVSSQSNRARDLVEQAITAPETVDAHDITIAQAEASLSLNIARTILSRLTQAWRDLINTR